MNRFLHLLAICTVCFSLFAVNGCRTTDESPTNPDPSIQYVTTTLVGVVSDESGMPVAGASVSAHGKTGTTNNYGVFMISNVSVPSDRCVIVVKKGGYFTASRAESPKSGGLTQLRLSMMSNTSTQNLGVAGGTLTVGAAKITIPANAFVTQSGTAYSGTAKIAARYITPDANNFYDFFSGDTRALRSDNSSTELVSYGVLRVEITSTSGETLKLASGKTATLTYPIPTSLSSQAASLSEIPLWYFDESKGLWVEDGKATKTGSTYIGTVTHFTDWNLDVPNARIAYLQGKVTCGSGEVVPNIVINVGQVSVFTDKDGNYKRRVPADYQFEVKVDGSRNDGISSTPQTVGPISLGATQTLDISVSPCPTMIQGTLTDCNDALIGGFIQIIINGKTKFITAHDGNFKSTITAGVAMTIEAFSINGQYSSTLNVNPITVGTTYNTGAIKACGGTQISFLDIPYSNQYTNLGFSADGTLIALVDGSDIALYSAVSGTLIRKISPGKTTYWQGIFRFSADGTKLLAQDSMTVKVYDVANATEILALPNVKNAYFSTDGTAIIGQNFTTGKVVKYAISGGALLKEYSLTGANLNLVGLTSGGTKFVATWGVTTTATVNVVIWDMTSDAKSHDFSIFSLETYQGSSLSPDGSVFAQTVYSNARKRELSFYTVANGQLISSLSADSLTVSSNGAVGGGGVPISPDNASFVASRYLQSGYFPSVLSIANGSVQKLLPIPDTKSYFSSFAYNASGSKLVGVAYGKVRVWTLQ